VGVAGRRFLDTLIGRLASEEAQDGAVLGVGLCRSSSSLLALDEDLAAT
jgi:hypothetical protein